MITQYGMSEMLGLATFEAPGRPCSSRAVRPAKGVQRADRRGDRRGNTTDAERGHERVRATLGAKRATLEAVAKRLIQQEVVDRAALVQLIAETEPATSG